jgi:hypothetical protein
MRVKAQQGCGCLMPLGDLLQLTQDSAVTHVHTIKRSNGQNGAFCSFGTSGKIGCVVMHSHFAKLGADFRGERTIFVPDFTR